MASGFSQRSLLSSESPTARSMAEQHDNAAVTSIVRHLVTVTGERPTTTPAASSMD